MKQMWEKIICGLLEVAVGLCIILSLGFWFPNWDMRWVMYRSIKRYEKEADEAEDNK